MGCHDIGEALIPFHERVLLNTFRLLVDFVANMNVNVSIAEKVTPFNNTDIDFVYAVQDWFGIFSTITGTILNCALLTVYFKATYLQTAFNTYVVNLSIAEILSGMFALVRHITTKFSVTWPLGEGFCGFVLYWIIIVRPEVRWGHVLIAFNRLWAVTFPIHYKQTHNSRRAKLIVLASWIFQHLVQLPIFILARISSDPKAKYCTLNTGIQPQLALFSQIIGYYASETVMLLTTCVVILKLAKRKRVGIKAARPIKVVNINRDMNGTGENALTPAIKKRNTENRILIYVLLGTVLCWTPNNVYYLLRNLGVQLKGTSFSVVQFVMLHSYSSLYPILYYIASYDFRRATNDVFCNYRNH